MEFTDKPKNAQIHVPNFNQFVVTNDSEESDYKTEVDKWTPSFDDLPDWVEWVSQDLGDGAWYGFKDKPKRDGDVWVNDGHAHYTFIEVTPLHPDGWENTLTKRPEKCYERFSVGGVVGLSDRGSVKNVDVLNQDSVKAVLLEGDSNYELIKRLTSVAQQSTQPHYQTKTGTDFIQRFSDVHSQERVRGALLFNIGKYCERYGEKDDTLKEARKIADYANRLVKFEESLLGG